MKLKIFLVVLLLTSAFCVAGLASAATTTAPTCSSFTYSSWSACGQTGVKTRTIITSSPAGCAFGNPQTAASCKYYPSCTDDNWTYTLSPSKCPASDQQIKYWTQIGTCSGGVTHARKEPVTCDTTITACTSFTYSDWSTCSQTRTQTRTVLTSLPAGCSNGVPKLSEACKYSPSCIEDNWTYSLSPIKCPASGQQTKTWTQIGSCSGGTTHLKKETVICNPQAPICTSFTYSDWSTCSQTGTQTRTVSTSLPSGCAGGSPVTLQPCAIHNVAPSIRGFGSTSSGIIPFAISQNSSVGFTDMTIGTNYKVTWDPTVWQPATILNIMIWVPTSNHYCMLGSPQNSAGGFTFAVPAQNLGDCTGAVVPGTGYYIDIYTDVVGQQFISNTFSVLSPGACTANNWTSILSPAVCPTSSQQTETWSKVGTCSGGMPQPATTTVQCNPQAPACTSWTYSDWSACDSSGNETRTVFTSLPSGCTGGTPSISQGCVPVGGFTNMTIGTNYKITWDPTTSYPGATTLNIMIWVPNSNHYCMLGSPQNSAGSFTFAVPAQNLGDCTGAVVPGTGYYADIYTDVVGQQFISNNFSILSPSSASTCTSWTYSDWSACNTSNTETRTIQTSSPSGCTGGTPASLSQACPISLTQTACNSQGQCVASATSDGSGCTVGNNSKCIVSVCTASNWTPTLSPAICPASDSQTETWSQVGTCSGGVTQPATTTVQCIYSSGSGLTFTSPVGGEQWTQGSTHNITWTGSDSGVPNCSVLLIATSKIFKNAIGWPSNVKLLSSSTIPVSAGSFSWTIGSDIPAGSYKIELNNPDNNGYNGTYGTHDSNSFTINASSAPLPTQYSIVVTSPIGMGLDYNGVSHPNIPIVEGSTQTISWTNTGTQPVSIYYWDVWGSPILIASNQSASGSYTWTAPSNVDIGKTYYIEVQTSNISPTVTSNTFIPTVTFAAPKPITITGLPLTCFAGQGCTITWNATGENNISIAYQVGSYFGQIANNIPATPGSYTWAVPANQSISYTGGYNLIITGSSDGYIASSFFSVFAPQPVNSSNVITCTLGQPCNITWTPNGSGKISLSYMASSLIGSSGLTAYQGITGVTSISATPSSYIWTIPGNVTAGDYSLLIEQESGYGYNYNTVSDLEILARGTVAASPFYTVGVYDPTASTFYLRNSNSTFIAGVAGSTSVAYGVANSGLLPIAGDWDGNGTTTVGLYDPSTSTFFLKNSNTAGNADITFGFGTAAAGLLPIAGDWDGNGTTTVGLYDPSTSTFFLKNSNTAGVADITFSFGWAGGLKPVVGDWTGSGKTTVGLYNPATFTFYLKNSNTAGAADSTFASYRRRMGFVISIRFSLHRQQLDINFIPDNLSVNIKPD
jgi:hypothetical protein